MSSILRRPLSIALGAAATAALGGCYYGDVNGASYASAGYACETRYGASYYDAYDPYAYDDGYGYDCYDSRDYGAGFIHIGFGGGWYDSYYYPGYGLWMFDSYRNRYPLRGHYLNYWGGRRAWWKHHGHRGSGHWNRPGRGDHDGRPGRPGGWNRGDRDGDGKGRPGRGKGVDNPISGHPGTPIGTPSPRPSRNPDGIRPRPHRPDLSSDSPGEGIGKRPPLGRPAVRARPAIDTRQQTERPAVRSNDPSPAVRSAPAPVTRSEPAPRPARSMEDRPAPRANRAERERAVRGD